jgi:hypothetical protein
MPNVVVWLLLAFFIFPLGFFTANFSWPRRQKAGAPKLNDGRHAIAVKIEPGAL